MQAVISLFFSTHKTNNYGGEELLRGSGYFGTACQTLKSDMIYNSQTKGTCVEGL